MSDEHETPDGDETVVVHRQHSEHYDLLGDNVYYPVNHRQYRDLVGKLLTHLDAMGLSDRTRRAARTLLVQELWRWWGESADNATTAGAGCLAPVVMRWHRYPADYELAKDGPPSNRWGFKSEQDYLDSLPTATHPE